MPNWVNAAEKPINYQKCLEDALYEKRVIKIRTDKVSIYCAGEIVVPSVTQNNHQPQEQYTTDVHQNIFQYLFTEFVAASKNPATQKRNLDILIGYILRELFYKPNDAILDFLHKLRGLPTHENIAELEIRILDSWLYKSEDTVPLDMERMVELAHALPYHDDCCNIGIRQDGTWSFGSGILFYAYHGYETLFIKANQAGITPPVSMEDFLGILSSKGLQVEYLER